MTLNIVWKLSCIDINTQRVFVWEKKKTGFNRPRKNPCTAKSSFPSNAAHHTAKAVTEEGVVLLLAGEGLWKYDLYSNQWTSLHCFDLHFSSSSLNGMRSFFSSAERLYILVSLKKSIKKIMLYSLEKRTWNVTESSAGLKPFTDVFSRLSVVTTKRYRYLLYTGEGENCNPSLWKLHRANGSWYWTKPNSSPPSPLSTVGEPSLAVSVNCDGSILYVLVQRFYSHVPRNELQLWGLQLNTTAWVLLYSFGESEPVYPKSSRMAVFYGSVVMAFYLNTFETALYLATHNTKNITWKFDAHLLSAALNGILPIRRDFCLASLNNTAVLIYGGVSPNDPNQYFCDLWLVMLQSPTSSNLQLFQLQPDCEDYNDSSHDSRPMREALYECVVVNNTLVIMGGRENEMQMAALPCSRNVWHFSMTDYIWVQAYNHSDFESYSRQMCITSTVSIGPSVVVTFQSSRNVSRGKMIRYELWMYVVGTRTWIFHSDMISMDIFLIFTWNQQIIFLSKDLGGLSYIRLVCPRGYVSGDISQESCSPCPEGSFAKGEGETKCTSCPEGLVTVSVASSTSSNCSSCKVSRCLPCSFRKWCPTTILSMQARVF